MNIRPAKAYDESLEASNAKSSKYNLVERDFPYMGFQNSAGEVADLLMRSLERQHSPEHPNYAKDLPLIKGLRAVKDSTVDFVFEGEDVPVSTAGRSTVLLNKYTLKLWAAGFKELGEKLDREDSRYVGQQNSVSDRDVTGGRRFVENLAKLIDEEPTIEGKKARLLHITGDNVSVEQAEAVSLPYKKRLFVQTVNKLIQKDLQDFEADSQESIALHRISVSSARLVDPNLRDSADNADVALVNDYLNSWERRLKGVVFPTDESESFYINGLLFSKSYVGTVGKEISERPKTVERVFPDKIIDLFRDLDSSLFLLDTDDEEALDGPYGLPANRLWDFDKLSATKRRALQPLIDVYNLAVSPDATFEQTGREVVIQAGAKKMKLAVSTYVGSPDSETGAIDDVSTTYTVFVEKDGKFEMVDSIDLEELDLLYPDQELIDFDGFPLTVNIEQQNTEPDIVVKTKGGKTINLDEFEPEEPVEIETTGKVAPKSTIQSLVDEFEDSGSVQKANKSGRRVEPYDERIARARQKTQRRVQTD